MALQSYQIQLNNLKAAEFAAQIFIADPSAAAPLLLQLAATLAGYSLFFWLIAALSGPNQSQSVVRSAAGLALTWISACWLILHCNLLAYPRSVWTWAVEPIMAQSVAWIIDLAAIIWLGRRIYLLGRTPSTARRHSAIVLFLATCVALAVAARWFYLHTTPHTPAAQGPSNIVIIGLDSLRRDIALSDDSPMPNLRAFRQTAYVQRNVVTPLARTFPAWTAMLTGESPAASGIRDNLVAQHGIGKRSVGWNFKAHGYRTIYATDETRFSNVGPDFGFDQVVSPQPGVADFLLGQFGDQSLVNLSIQIPFAEYLLPSLVGNRAFAHAYKPRRFIERLVDTIGPAGSQKTLLAVHLCVAHWPYFSANSPSNVPSPYLRAINELDTQLGQLMKALRRLGYINSNSMVVLLADHGEGVPELRGTVAEQFVHDDAHVLGLPAPGHGGTLLDPAQWQVFLMFGGHSALGDIPSGSSDQLLSLQDLPHALQQLSGAKVEAPYTMDVVNHTSGQTGALSAGRTYVAMETGFGPKDFNPIRPNGEEALRIAEDSFDVLDDGRVEMKDSVFLSTLENKDYGVTNGSDVLAVVNTGADRQLVSTDLTRNRWDIYTVAHRATMQSLPLLDSACADSDMALRLSAWCPASARH